MSGQCIMQGKTLTWKTVPGYGNYEISNYGQVRRTGGGMGATIGRELKPYKSPSGYLSVALSGGGRMRRFRVNRLVLMAFVGEPAPRMESSHIDGDRLNNFVGNLVWESTQENSARRKVHGTSKGARNSRAKLSNDDVREIRKHYASEKTSYTALAKKFGVSFAAIGHIVTGRQWSHIGINA